MALINITTPADGENADASDVASPLNTIVSEFNGNIDNANIKSGAAIATSKLASDAGIATGMIADAAVTVAKRSGGFKTGTLSPSTTGNFSITGVGFRPKLLVLITRVPSNAAIASGGWGVTDGTTQYATFLRTASGSFGQLSYTDRIAVHMTSASATDVEISYVSFDADGFTLNANVRSASRDFTWVAFG
jgi:hypothetical protein